MITVFVSGEGDYEFSLNNINGPYQDSNVFENVPPGLHTVYVRDKNDCGIVEDIVSVIGFPKFLTPNGDGYHDTWQVYGLNHSSQIESIVYIFDRYGKLIKQLSPSGIGWDGTFNGQPLPSSDYWFHVKLQDGRTFKSHFTLKR
jgi:gliding motility-associated-like protein